MPPTPVTSGSAAASTSTAASTSAAASIGAAAFTSATSLHQRRLHQRRLHLRNYLRQRCLCLHRLHLPRVSSTSFTRAVQSAPCTDRALRIS